ncbi:hypothetical protein [Mesorhizobium sp. M0220]|uniref:hypothetical protein n=1 Tax=unclassified Mesorhizobium TaxID=325217 RepID=UPI00333E0CCE
MTAEICVMNRLAVVLAADSATTVTYWGENGREERYFKGANKIFQLSNSHPVGVMIFDSADLLKVPWEVVIKDFRRYLGDKSFNSVAEYATEFFSYIDGNNTMFPASVQHEAFLEAVRSAIFTMLVVPSHNSKIPEDQKKAVQDAVAAKENELAGVNILPCIDEKNLEEAIISVRDEMIAYVRDLISTFKLPEVDDLEKLITVAVTDVFKQPQDHMSTAGLVFAGFGDRNVFPSMAPYTSFGMLAGHHVHLAGESINIDHELPAWMEPFAQRNMADTFSAGVSRDVYSSTMGAVVEGLASFIDELGKAVGFDPAKIANLGDLIGQARKAISDAVMDRARKEHAIPMRRILGALPVDELAELAETLINLQSLKEKVTKPSASVGGPVDVAVITRSEGLVWIKRKHYFDPAINSRYMARQQAT